MLCERSLEYGNEVHICFVDFEKAFDRVNWVTMMHILERLGIDWRDRRLAKELCIRQEMIVRVADGDSELGTIDRGIRQGCQLFPLLFSIYAESIMKEGLDGG